MSTLLLAGWCQPPEALHVLVPDASAFDYSRYGTPEQALEVLDAEGEHECVIGWSMGGWLAARAVAAGALKPRLLVLVAAPFQFVADASMPHGMSRPMFDLFCSSYENETARTASKFHALIAKGDARAIEIARKLTLHPDTHNAAYWLPWLKALDAMPCHDLTFGHFPTTLVVQGARDAIVHPCQAELWMKHIPDAELLHMPESGHAPHLHAPEQIRQVIARHV